MLYDTSEMQSAKSRFGDKWPVSLINKLQGKNKDEGGLTEEKKFQRQM